MVCLPIIIYSDDTSGNHSKKFDLWTMTFAGLPCKDNGNLENIHFLCASNKVSVNVCIDQIPTFSYINFKVSAIEMALRTFGKGSSGKWNNYLRCIPQ